MQRRLHPDRLRCRRDARRAYDSPRREYDGGEPGPEQHAERQIHETRARAYSVTRRTNVASLTALREAPGEDHAGMSSATSISSYEEACARHRWDVHERYNIALDVCDRHPREKLAVVHEHFDGTVQEVNWGQLQDDSNRFAAPPGSR